MENERKEYKEKTNYGKQVFYFNDKGQLVVESNKGVWVDGEKFVKMYGDFTCNAKTIGTIIAFFKDKQVIIGEEWRQSDGRGETKSFCLVEAESKINEMLDHKNELANKWYKEYNDIRDKNDELKDKVDKFNLLPWWKRMFKKIEVK